jgi:hypothetical protein
MSFAESQGKSVFISYRRGDTPGVAGRLYDRLCDRFGESRVFMDVDSIELGLDFIDALQRAVSTCEALLVMIGPNWLDSRDESGRQRLEDPDDYVRVEVETGLRRDIRVIPILVADARMPAASDLPESLRPLSRRQAVHTSSSLMEPSPVAESST